MYLLLTDLLPRFQCRANESPGNSDDSYAGGQNQSTAVFKYRVHRRILRRFDANVTVGSSCPSKKNVLHLRLFETSKVLVCSVCVSMFSHVVGLRLS